MKIIRDVKMANFEIHHSSITMSLSGKRALVCGSTGGIGKAIAKALAEMGASIVLMARNEEKLRLTLNELPKNSEQVHDFLVADFSDVEGVNQKITDYVAKGNNIHILINNTGGPPGGPISEATLTAFQEAFNMHLLCNHTLTLAVKQGMIDDQYGRIVNIISTSVKQPLTGLGVSNTIRGAVANWSKTMANELGVHGITVNNVLPGATATERLSSIAQNKANKLNKSTEEIMQQFENAVPMKRIGKAEEVAAAAAFLASPSASYINGINLPVDGGRTSSL